MNPLYIALLATGGIIIALLLILINQTFLIMEKIEWGKVMPYNEFVSTDDDRLFLVIMRVIQCESQFNNSAKGKHGEIGIAQFLPNTFKNFSKKYNLTLDINNEQDQIKLMMLMFRNGYANLWVCYNQLKAKKII